VEAADQTKREKEKRTSLQVSGRGGGCRCAVHCGKEIDIKRARPEPGSKKRNNFVKKKDVEYANRRPKKGDKERADCGGQMKPRPGGSPIGKTGLGGEVWGGSSSTTREAEQRLCKVKGSVGSGCGKTE